VCFWKNEVAKTGEDRLQRRFVENGEKECWRESLRGNGLGDENNCIHGLVFVAWLPNREGTWSSD
jgi:hypothetical protein